MTARNLAGSHLNLPDDFPEHEWEVTAKGWFAGAYLTVSGRRYRLVFYEPVRLAQDIQAELERGQVFFEPNLVVVQSVTRSEMDQAAEWLVQSGQSASLLADDLSQTD